MRIRARRDQRGVVLPTSVMFLCVIAVVAAAVAFTLTATSPAPERAATVAQEPMPTQTVQPTITPKPKPKPRVVKGQTYVEVYNNTNISGLAGRAAGEAQAAGWNVVGSDNWVGTISTSTVYYPPRLAAAANSLAKDLRIGRTKEAIAPMRLDRLTVVLTGDYR